MAMNRLQRALALLRLLGNVRMISSLVILIFIATGLRPTMDALGRRFEKRSAHIRKSLDEFDTFRLPSFRDGWKHDRLDHSGDDVGTDEYVSVTFYPKSAIKDFYSHMVVTYYCDPKDKVPHTPDVCYRQMGAVVKKMMPVVVDVPELGPERSRVEATMLFLELPTVDKVVIFGFYVEGQFRKTRSQVRLAMGMPGKRRTYFSKFEANSDHEPGSSPDEAIELCKTIIREALPILVSEHFPTAEQLMSE